LTFFFRGTHLFPDQKVHPCGRGLSSLFWTTSGHFFVSSPLLHLFLLPPTVCPLSNNSNWSFGVFFSFFIFFFHWLLVFCTFLSASCGSLEEQSPPSLVLSPPSPLRPFEVNHSFPCSYYGVFCNVSFIRVKTLEPSSRWLRPPPVVCLWA